MGYGSAACLLPATMTACAAAALPARKGDRLSAWLLLLIGPSCSSIGQLRWFLATQVSSYTLQPAGWQLSSCRLHIVAVWPSSGEAGGSAPFPCCCLQILAESKH